MIVQYGIERTGTTLIWQILKDLFDNSIKKTHDYIRLKEEDRAVVTYRDFRDVVVSLWRAQSNNKGNIVIPKKDLYMRKNLGKHQLKSLDKPVLDLILTYVLSGITTLNKYKSDYADKVLFLKYEKFYTNYEYIYDNLESFFKIKIPYDKRTELSKRHNFMVNKNIADKMAHFGEYEPESGIHGDHMHKGLPGTYKEFLSKELEEYLSQRLKDHLITRGYRL